MQAHRLPARHGVFWLVNGFYLYRRNPPLLSMLTFANLLLALFCSLLQPIGPFLLVLASPLIITLIANACAAIAVHGPLQLKPAMLTRGLRDNLRQLLRLGMVQLACLTLATLLVDAVLPQIDPAMLTTAQEAGKTTGKIAGPDAETIGWLLLNITLVGLMTLPAFWFAPLLTAWHGTPPVKSVFFSFVAVWRNWRAFFAYAASAAVIAVLIPALLLALFNHLGGPIGSFLGTLVQLLVLLTAAPVLATGAYCSYREIMTETPPEEPA